MKVKIDVSEYTEADEVADRVWHSGYRSFVDGAFRHANPYDGWTGEFVQWQKGWLAAEKITKE